DQVAEVEGGVAAAGVLEVDEADAAVVQERVGEVGVAAREDGRGGRGEQRGVVGGEPALEGGGAVFGERGVGQDREAGGGGGGRRRRRGRGRRCRRRWSGRHRRRVCGRGRGGRRRVQRARLGRRAGRGAGRRGAAPSPQLAACRPGRRQSGLGRCRAGAGRGR